ncbi:MAG: hypothetical protein F4X64_00680 [Chloroflexi bacterium]|nr:hypothetical protein [Chloroflexota bacterium]
MPGLILSGIIGGLIFGVILVWQGAAAAGVVVLFTLLGLVVGFLIWMAWRLVTGQVDIQALRALIDVLFFNRSR